MHQCTGSNVDSTTKVERVCGSILSDGEMTLQFNAPRDLKAEIVLSVARNLQSQGRNLLTAGWNFVMLTFGETTTRKKEGACGNIVKLLVG